MGGYWSLINEDGSIVKDSFVLSFAKRTKENLAILDYLSSLNEEDKL